MSQPEFFMNDAAVTQALTDLETAARAALAARGRKFKLAAVVVHADDGERNAAAMFGCHCFACKLNLAKSFADAIGRKPDEVMATDVSSFSGASVH